MSTRWYPLYQRGNPQLRVFLPNFWMKLLPPKAKSSPNVVYFGCSMEMTNYDVKNYLEKIYKIPIINVHTFIEMGKFRKALGGDYIVKDDDLKVAKITMPHEEKFEYPNLFDEQEEEETQAKNQEQLDVAKKNWNDKVNETKQRPGVPSWFTF